MVKARESSVFQYPPAWKPPNLNGTGTSFKPRKQGSVTSDVNPGSPFCPSIAGCPGFTVIGIPGSNFHHESMTTDSIQYSPSHVLAFPPGLNLYVKNAPLVSHESARENPTLGSSGKRFFVFDQCEKGTRLIYGESSHLLQKSEALRKRPCGNFPAEKGKHPSNLTQFGLYNPIFQEESDENHVDGEEGEMCEDTEEINALLYSDDDDEHDEKEGQGEEDEVTSTGHTPSALVQCCGKCNKVEDTLDEVGNFSHQNKRQKLITSEYDCFNSLHMDKPLIKLDGTNRQGSDADSSFVISRTNEEDKFPVVDGDLSKKDKIREMMKILEAIVPSAEGKDPVVILEKAIEYLKNLKCKAKVLGMSIH